MTFGIGLISSDFYEFYVNVIRPIFTFVPNWVLSFFNWELMDWYEALLPISFIFAAAVIRMLLSSVYDKYYQGLWVGAAVVFIVGSIFVPILTFTFLGIVYFIPILLGAFRKPAVSRSLRGTLHGKEIELIARSQQRSFRMAVLSVCMGFLALFLAFVENWYA